MAYSQSKVKSWRRCQKQFGFRHDYAPVGKEMVRRAPKLALSRGTWMHSLQEAHHREWAGVKGKKADWEAVHERNTRKFNTYFEEDREELGDLPGECERLWRSYLRYWTEDQDRYQVARLDGGTPAVEFTVEVPLSRWGIVEPFKGRLDLLVADQEYGGLWIWDHKWVKRIPDVDERMMSPQALMYAWALIKLGYDVRGFLYNYGRTKPPTIPRHLVAGGLSVAKNIDTDFHTYAREIQIVHGKHWKKYARTQYRDTLIRLKNREALWFRRERIPVERDRIKQALVEFLTSVKQIERRAKPEKAPRSYFYNCSQHCDYHDLCVTEFKGLDITPLVRDRYEVVPERYTEDGEGLLVA